MIWSQDIFGAWVFEVHAHRPAFPFAEVEQTHSCDIVPLKQQGAKADGLWALGESLPPMLIKTADCMPIAIRGAKGLCFLHAGWRGLAKGILGQQALRSLMPEQAFIGPCISQANYEVGQDVRDAFPLSFAFKEGPVQGKWLFSLRDQAREELLALYPGIQVRESGLCTFQDTRFHSFRREKGPARNWNLLRHKEF